ncbi:MULTISPECIES: hypothetical protein [Nitratireductor]|nr:MULTISPECIES: hypothetical protein [Nitratireductor]MDV2965442.1 hypothetical protein [Nitratireductor aquimarinus]
MSDDKRTNAASFKLALLETVGEANRLRQQYASQGIIGWNPEAQ